MGRPNGKKESLKNSLLLTSSDTCIYNKRCSKNHIAWWKFHCCHQSYWLYQLPKLKSMVGNIFQLNVSLDEVVGWMGLLLAFYSSEMHRNVIRLIKNVTQCIFKWSGRRMGLLLTSTLFNRRVPSPWAEFALLWNNHWKDVPVEHMLFHLWFCILSGQILLIQYFAKG